MSDYTQQNLDAGRAAIEEGRMRWERHMAQQRAQRRLQRQPQRRVLQPGDLFTANNKLFTICTLCHGIVRVDKPLFGSLHFCGGV